MAVAVMFYHYVDWSLGSTSGLVAKLGIYAVSVFYILSGLSLTLAYRDRLATWTDLGVYGLKRLFRIAPLFWLATTATLSIALARSVVNGTTFTLDAWRLLANYSLTFGFFAPDAYYATGAWSIGNEIVFYAAFPLALWLFRRSLTRSILAAVALLFLAVFAFGLISPAKSLSEQWALYVNPLNQIPFFLAGMLIATRLGLGQEYLLHLHLLACVPLTLLASWLSYQFLEQPGMRLGQNFAAAWRSRRTALVN